MFFGKSWLNKVIEFDGSLKDDNFTNKWKIVRKLTELCLQGNEEEWKSFEHDPMESIGVFECVNITKEEAPPGIMKIYMQFGHPFVPYFILSSKF